MPQMPAVLPNVPPSTPKAHPPGAPGSNDQNSFSPHLDRAVSGKKQVPPGKAAQEQSCDVEQNNQPAPLDAPEDSVKTLAYPVRKSPAEDADENAEQALLSPNAQENSRPTPPSFLTRLRPAEYQATQPDNAAAGIASQVPSLAIAPEAHFLASQSSNTSTGETGQVPFSLTISAEITAQISETAGTGQTTPGITGKQDALMRQLQDIIASSRDSEAVPASKADDPAIKISVDRNFYSSLNTSLAGKMEAASMSASMQTVESRQNELLLADGDSLTFTPGKPLHQLTGIRHDGQQQYLATKINGEAMTDTGQNFQDSQPDGELARQATGTFLASSPFNVTEQTTTFSTMATLAQDLITPPTTEPAKPILLPSGIIVHEHEVMQQLTEKFHLSGKNLDSRINLTLHPAELGELKIDLTLKEGAIRANIVAQSQHTLEILEKNLPKLKTMLENQGLDIDQIELAAESESVTDFDLFDRQLFGNNEQQHATQKGRIKEDGEFTLEDIPFTTPAVNSGVNVKI